MPFQVGLLWCHIDGGMVDAFTNAAFGRLASS